MTANRKIAITAGVLFILAAVTAIIGLALYNPILNDPNYIVNGEAHETQVVWGAFFEIALGFAVIGTSIGKPGYIDPSRPQYVSFKFLWG